MAKKDIPETVIQTAYMINLPRFLEQQGIELKEYRSCWEYGTGAEKVTVWQDRKDGHYQWMRQYDRLSGNAIQWMQTFGGSRSFPDAVFYLYDWAGGRPITELEPRTAAAAPVEEKKKSGQFRLPPANRSFSRCMAYLCKTRKLDPELVTFFHKVGLIYESAIHHNAVFVGRDPQNVPRHANLRGTVTSEKGRAFKGNWENSDPGYSFHWAGYDGLLYVFEAPIDLLSFISIYRENWRQHSYLALCGTFTDGLTQFIADHPYIRKAVLCLDNDEAGEKGNHRCAEALEKLGIPWEVLPPRNNDWNDDLKEVRP